jgi:hypothetical protein
MPRNTDDPNDVERAALLPAYDIRGMGGWIGAQQGLQQIVADRALQASTDRKHSQEDFTNYLNMRKQLGEDDKLTQQAYEFGQNAPTRASAINYQGAQADDLRGKPAAATLAFDRENEQKTTAHGREVVLKVVDHMHNLAEEEAKSGNLAKAAELTRTANHMEGLLRDQNRKDVAWINQQGGPNGTNKPLNPTTQRMIAANDSILASLDRVEELYPKAAPYMGPLQGRLTKFATSMPDSISEQLIGKDVPPEAYEMQTILSNLENVVIQARTGAAVREAEEPRLRREIAGMIDKPELFKAKVGRMRNMISFINRRYQQLGSGEELEPMPADFGSDAGATPAGTPKLQSGRGAPAAKSQAKKFFDADGNQIAR